MPVSLAMRNELAMRSWLNAVRARQWSKNLLLFVPLILSRTFVDPAAVVRVAGAFLIFNAVVSASYLFNDVLDIESDRRHPSKQKRALAAGAFAFEVVEEIESAFFKFEDGDVGGGSDF